MPPRRYLNSTEAGKLMGLSRRAVTQRLARHSGTIPEPDAVIHVDGIGDIHGWDPEREDLTPEAVRGREKSSSEEEGR